MKGSWSVLNLFTMSCPSSNMKARSLRKQEYQRTWILVSCVAFYIERIPPTWWRRHRHCSSKFHDKGLLEVSRASKVQVAVCLIMAYSLVEPTNCRLSISPRKCVQELEWFAPLDLFAFGSNQCKSVLLHDGEGIQQNVEGVEMSLILWRFSVQRELGELWQCCWLADSSLPVNFTVETLIDNF